MGINFYEKAKSERVFFSDYIFMAWVAAYSHLSIGIIILLVPSIVLMPGETGQYLAAVMFALAFKRFVEGARDSHYIDQLGKGTDTVFLDPAKYKFSQEHIELGEGFAWLRKHRQAMEDVDEQEISVDENEKRGGWTIFHHLGLLDMKPLKFSRNTILAGFIIIYGATGKGKTSMLRFIQQQFLRYQDEKGYNAQITIDPKGDDDLCNDWFQGLAQTGRLNEGGYIFLCPLLPKGLTASFNFLESSQSPGEMVDRAMTLYDDDNMFYDNASEVLKGIIYGLWYLREMDGTLADKPITIKEVYYWTSQRPRHHELFSIVLGKHMDSLGIDISKMQPKEWYAALQMHERVHHIEPNDAVESLATIIAYLDSHFPKIMAGITPSLSLAVDSSIDHVFSPDGPSDWSWEKIVTEGIPAYAFLSSLVNQKLADVIAKVLYKDMISFLGRYQAFVSKKERREFYVIADESAKLVTPDSIDSIAMGRGAGLRIVLATQSPVDYEAVLKDKATARRFQDNISSVIAFPMNNNESNKMFAESSPEVSVRTTMSQHDSAATAHDEKKLFTSKVASRTQEMSGERIQPGWVRALPVGEFWAIMSGGLTYKGAAPLLTEVTTNYKELLFSQAEVRTKGKNIVAKVLNHGE